MSNITSQEAPSSGSNSMKQRREVSLRLSDLLQLDSARQTAIGRPPSMPLIIRYLTFSLFLLLLNCGDIFDLLKNDNDDNNPTTINVTVNAADPFTGDRYDGFCYGFCHGSPVLTFSACPKAMKIHPSLTDSFVLSAWKLPLRFKQAYWRTKSETTRSIRI